MNIVIVAGYEREINERIETARTKIRMLAQSGADAVLEWTGTDPDRMEIAIDRLSEDYSMKAPGEWDAGVTLTFPADVTLVAGDTYRYWSSAAGDRRTYPGNGNRKARRTEAAKRRQGATV